MPKQVTLGLGSFSLHEGIASGSLLSQSTQPIHPSTHLSPQHHTAALLPAASCKAKQQLEQLKVQPHSWKRFKLHSHFCSLQIHKGCPQESHDRQKIRGGIEVPVCQSCKR